MPTMAETKVNYKVKVININTHLRIRDGAGTTHNIVGRRNNGDTFEVDRVRYGIDKKVQINGLVLKRHLVRSI